MALCKTWPTSPGLVWVRLLRLLRFLRICCGSKTVPNSAWRPPKSGGIFWLAEFIVGLPTSNVRSSHFAAHGRDFQEKLSRACSHWASLALFWQNGVKRICQPTAPSGGIKIGVDPANQGSQLLCKSSLLRSLFRVLHEHLVGQWDLQVEATRHSFLVFSLSFGASLSLNRLSAFVACQHACHPLGCRLWIGSSLRCHLQLPGHLSCKPKSCQLSEESLFWTKESRGY